MHIVNMVCVRMQPHNLTSAKQGQLCVHMLCLAPLSTQVNLSRAISMTKAMQKVRMYAGHEANTAAHATPPESAFSQPAVQQQSVRDPATTPQDAATATSAAQHHGLPLSPSAQLNSASSPHRSGISSYSRHTSQDADALAAFAQSGPTASSMSEQSEAQVRNTLTAASQPLPPDASAELDAKAVDDRFVTMSSADALEEAVRSENDAAEASPGGVDVHGLQSPQLEQAR